MSTKQDNNSDLQVEMKVGILNTIARSIYSDLKLKIREAAANSMDNKATWFVIYADSPTRTISLMDNGDGISRDRFNEIFKSMGYGKDRNEKYSNSYFGLGLMSILEIGGKADIISKSKSGNEIMKLNIESKEIFSKEMEAQPLASIEKYMKLSPSDLAERERISNLKTEEIEEKFNGFPSHFTEIIISDIDKDVFEEITSGDFEIELKKILPLKTHENDPFLHSIKDPSALKWLKEIFNDSKYCPTIDVYVGISEGEKEISQIWKYYPDFERDLEFGKGDIEFGESDKKDFAYYYICSTGDLEKRDKKNKETGIWVRNRNFLVKEADYFQKPGSRKKIITDPLKGWLFGEIFHENMTEFLVVTRDEYVWESDKFKKFKNRIYDILYKLNEDLRDAWKSSNIVMDSIVNPFLDVGGQKDPFKRTYDVLSKMGVIGSERDAEDILEKLNVHRRTDIEVEEKRIDKLIDKDKENIIMADDERVKVIIDREIDKDYIKQREMKTNRVILKISPRLFRPQKVEFLGKTFEVSYVACEKEEPGISIDTENFKIFVNPFNQDVLKFSLSFIDTYIAIQIADILSETKKEMKNYLLELLSKKLTKDVITPEKYLLSLKDDLSRRRASE